MLSVLKETTPTTPQGEEGQRCECIDENLFSSVSAKSCACCNYCCGFHVILGSVRNSLEPHQQISPGPYPKTPRYGTLDSFTEFVRGPFRQEVQELTHTPRSMPLGYLCVLATPLLTMSLDAGLCLWQAIHKSGTTTLKGLYMDTPKQDPRTIIWVGPGLSYG